MLIISKLIYSQMVYLDYNQNVDSLIFILIVIFVVISVFAITLLLKIIIELYVKNMIFEREELNV